MPGIDAVCSAEHGELTAKGVDHVEDERLAEVGLGSGVLLPGRLAAALRAFSMHTIPSYSHPSKSTEIKIELAQPGYTHLSNNSPTLSFSVCGR